ncbi:uncharacterized protein LOC119431222 isoform X3 [Dermacentor silvarum]|uniref:uncharacterized protein LOC119431222 isoform X3 n=1 Tax=Dermacentor silvarum TaxID=543639 RepID=UPI0021007997|nr:uncharacterized protein LOC119431222 isoform X3 [Dermacentor silvarum]
MPDHGTGRVHRFRDHVIAGVNWRPTRFVDEVPNSRVCGLCRMIPKQTVLLPCSHALCQSCHGASLEGGVGHCPLDQEPFEETECNGVNFPARKASSLKVHCWNEAHGCEYTDTMDRMLEHYEKECTFHSVECLRCGVVVHHSDLQMHYVAGCIAGGSSAIAEYPSSNHTALTLEDVSAALEDLKTMLGDPNHDQLLPVIQSQLNELTEQVRNQEARFAVITSQVRASEHNLKGEIAQIAATISSTASDQLTAPQNPVEEASTSSSLSLRSEKALILRKLEHLAHQTHDVLERWRQTFPQRDSSRVIAYCKPWDDEIRHFTSALSTTAARVKEFGRLRYFLTLENCQEIIQWRQGRRKLAQITVWHMRDTYFTLAVWTHYYGRHYGSHCDSTGDLIVEIVFNGVLEDSKCLPSLWRVNVVDSERRKSRLLTSSREFCFCRDEDYSYEHFHLEFSIGIGSLKNDGFLRIGKIEFWIDLDDDKMNGGVTGAY